MQKMKNGLMMFCLTVLLSCAALMMNTPTASAMTLADLQGDYRIIWECSAFRHYGCNNKGCIVSFVMEDGALVGKQKDVSGKLTGHVYVYNVYVQNGTAHCSLSYSPGLNRSDCWIKISNNGAVLEIVDNAPIHDDEPVAFRLNRL